MKESFVAIGARISNMTSNATRARLYDVAAGQYIDSTDISGLSSGDAFRLDGDLQNGQKYNIVVDAEGSHYNPGFNNSVSYPIEGSEFNLVSGVTNTSTLSSNAEGISDVGNPDGILG
jgi:hypothetical protein